MTLTTTATPADIGDNQNDQRYQHSSLTLTYLLPTATPFLPTSTLHRSSSSNQRNHHRRRSTQSFQISTRHPHPCIYHRRSVISNPSISSTHASSSSSDSIKISAHHNDESKGQTNGIPKQTKGTDSTSKEPINKNWSPFKSWFAPQPPPPPTTTSTEQQSNDYTDDSVTTVFQTQKTTTSTEADGDTSESEQEENSEKQFRWPWQNENVTSDDDDKTSATTEIDSETQEQQVRPPKKRVKHSDSKPGASMGIDDQNFVETINTNKIDSVQERWKQLVKGITQGNQTPKPSSKNEEDEDDTQAQSALPLPRRGSGIFELYKPPSQLKRQQDQTTGGNNKPWFTPPWKRDSLSKNNTENTREGSLSGAESSELKISTDCEDGNNENKRKHENSDSSSSKSTEKPWFTPPWNRNQEDDGLGTSSLNEGLDNVGDVDGNVGVDVTKDNSLLRDSLSEDTNNPTEREIETEGNEKVKVTFPTKKPWFRWPGIGTPRKENHMNESDDNNGNNIKRDDTSKRSSISTKTPIPVLNETTGVNNEKKTEETDDTKETQEINAKDVNGMDDKNQSQKTLVGVSSSSRKNGSNSSNQPSLESYSIPQRDIARIRQIFGSETFFATDTIPAPGGLLFHGNLRGEPQKAVDKLEERLSSRFGDKYTLCLAEGEDQGPVVVVVPTSYHQLSAAPKHRLLALGLGMMTISSCLSRGLMANVLRPRIISAYGIAPKATILQQVFFSSIGGTISVAAAIGFMVLISQVVVRRFVASLYRTKLAMPFMLPSYQLGSFGAVVYLVSPAPSRSALFDIAIASTIAMVIPAMICLIIGLRLSTTFTSVFPVPMSMVSGSLLMGWMTRFIPNGQILVDYQRSLIGLHPLAIIGANCLTIAALNLLPIRQLDGSRIIAALFGRRAAVKAWRMAVLYVLFASSKNPYLIMFLLIVSFGPWQVDRPSRNELTEPDNVRTIVGYLFMLLMISLLLPYPKSSFFGTL